MPIMSRFQCIELIKAEYMHDYTIFIEINNGKKSGYHPMGACL